MKFPNRIAFYSLLLSVTALFTSVNEAQAGRFFARGANGSAGAVAQQNQYGGRFAARAHGANMGGGAGAASYAGPNGGSFQGSNVNGYKRGLGSFRNSSWSGKSPNGSSGSGSTQNRYNAQTGQGQLNNSEQFKNAQGTAYGFNDSTSYAKGQGANTVLNTDNKGSYDVNFQKGQTPVVTQE